MVGRRALGTLAGVLAMTPACAVENSAYGGGDQGSGAGTGGETHAGGSTTGPDRGSTTSTTSKSESGATSDASTTSTSNGPGTTPATTDMPTTCGSTSDDTGGETTGERSGTSDPTRTIEPSAVLLFASDLQNGAFAMGSTVVEAGRDACIDAADEAGFPLQCIWLIPIIATADTGFPELLDAHPGLDEAPLSSVDGNLLAESYEDLVNGAVAQSFEEDVTAHLGEVTDPSFWWGPRAAGEPDCSGWMTTMGNGQALTFDSESSMVLPSMNSCNQQRYLLCACAAE